MMQSKCDQIPPQPPFSKGGNGGITKNQIKKIHTLTSKLKMPDDEYRLILSDYWVNTSKNLKYHEAQALIKKLEARAVEKGVWKTYLRVKKYDNLGKREGMSSPRQLRMIEAMWRDASWTHDPAKRQVALRRFIFRIAGVDDLVFLTSEGARKVIKAIQSMRRKHPPKSPLGKGGIEEGSSPHPLRDRPYGGI